MRQGQQGKRPRGRGGRRPNNSRNQVFDSNGPSVRIRGNALQIYEKYQQLARDSSSAGDRVSAETLLQHADHYYRIHSANSANAPSPASPNPANPATNGAERGANSGEGNAAEANGVDNGAAADTDGLDGEADGASDSDQSEPVQA